MIALLFHICLSGTHVVNGNFHKRARARAMLTREKEFHVLCSQCLTKIVIR